MLFRRVLVAQLKRPKSSLAAQHFEEIPSAKGLPLVGTALDLIASGSSPKLHTYVDKRHRQLGPIFKERLGPAHCVFISDPEEMRDVFAQEGRYPMHLAPDAWAAYNRLHGRFRGLFFMDGPDWWHHRRLVNKQLLKGDLKWIEDSCDYVSDKLLEHLQSTITNHGYYENLEDTLYKWSVDVIVSVLLGAEAYAECSGSLAEEVAVLAKKMYLVFQTSSEMALIPSSIASKLKIPRWRRFVRSVDQALEGGNRLVNRLIRELSPKSNGLLPKLLNEDMDIENVKRIIVDMVLAAGDTSTYAMEWSLYMLGKNPAVQEELRRDPSFVKFVFRETLRLYPVATFLTRILPEDATLSGFRVPKGSLIVLSMYTSGRDGRYFKNPDSFEPRRWDREDKDYNIGMQKATLPFGMGLRGCVGRKVAENQLYKALNKIVQNFEVEVGNSREVDIKLKMVAVPSEPLKLKFKRL
ncbi:p450 domain containing protein [Asbolus verrucosus]|uniref:p450 domain containing protein n=1 Tax=Asbolus verrucosus TaxID=1661398 RepID=A0A482W5S2_ASBVE|nr:p450 domain containing protein [Asbolus verrucosus]